MLAAIDSGFFRREIAEAAYAEQRLFERGAKVIVGVNRFEEPEEPPIELLRGRPAVEWEQVESLRRDQAGPGGADAAQASAGSAGPRGRRAKTSSRGSSMRPRPAPRSGRS